MCRNGVWSMRLVFLPHLAAFSPGLYRLRDWVSFLPRFVVFGNGSAFSPGLYRLRDWVSFLPRFILSSGLGQLSPPVCLLRDWVSFLPRLSLGLGQLSPPVYVFFGTVSASETTGAKCVFIASYVSDYFFIDAVTVEPGLSS